VRKRMIAPSARSTLNTARPRRQFTLFDAMALVAAMAVACGLTLWIDRASGGFMSWCLPELLAKRPKYSKSPFDHSFYLTDLVGGEVVALSCLSLLFFAVLTMFIIPIRLFNPRPQFRRLVRQPGTMAAIAASLGIAIAILQVTFALLFAIHSMLSKDDLYILALLGGVASYPGIAVFFVWMTLLLGGWWRAEPDWVDRAGRVCGAYWMTMGLSMPATILFLRWGG
jgi:hypothetical protein